MLLRPQVMIYTINKYHNQWELISSPTVRVTGGGGWGVLIISIEGALTFA